MEVETAVRRYLLSNATVAGYVQTKVFRHRLEEPIEGSGGRAVVVMRNPGWASPDPVQTSEYPTVLVDCHADPTRDDFGAIASLDAEDKAFALARAVEMVMHGRRGERWGGFGSDPGLMVVSCQRWQEPRLITHADEHGGRNELGDTVVVRTTWALHTAHERRSA